MIQLDRKYSFTKCTRYILQNDIYLFKSANFQNKHTIILLPCTKICRYTEKSTLNKGSGVSDKRSLFKLIITDMSIIRLGSCILCIHFNLRGGTCASMCANVPSTYTMTTACPSYLPTYLPTHLLVHIHSPNLSRFCNALLSLNASKLCECSIIVPRLW